MAVSSLFTPSRFEVLDALRGRDFLTIESLAAGELRSLLALAIEMKQHPDAFDHALAGRTLALVFEKPSLRTRVSFDVGMFQLGGHAVYLGPSEVGLGTREPVGDVAGTLAGMVDGIMARTFRHETLEQLADASKVPVINGLSDHSHPCQALADFQTILEVKRHLAGVRLAYIGDGNNVAHSLISAAALLGVRMSVATPPGYEPAAGVVAWARAHQLNPGAGCVVTNDPVEAVRDADVVYTDTWVSMGQEADAVARRRAFSGFEVTAELMRHAGPDAIFMHCLPAHRGEEVSAEVIDSRRSVVFQQAENRLHAQKAALYALLH